MLRKALLFFGWGTIFFTYVYEFRELIGLLDAVGELDSASSQAINSEIISLTLTVIAGFFQGVGIGLLCLFAADKIKHFGGSND